jgi:hypothetical protein
MDITSAHDAPLPFDSRAAFDPAADFDAFLKKVPACWVIYLMSDEQDRPVQLLCVKNLRASLKRRLGDPAATSADASLDPVSFDTLTAPTAPAAPTADSAVQPLVPMAGLTRRVNYRELIRVIHWRRVDSAFEADWLYYEAARQVFPASYQGMLGFRPAWFVHINPQTLFPRYTKTTALAGRGGLLFGPLDDKHAAARLVQIMEDAFDLCRYFSILVQSPSASACAYKGMGKCPAPCDGSISMDQYHQLIDLSVHTLAHPADAVREQTVRMQSAAAELRFELAAKIKTYVDQLSQLGRGAYRHVRPLDDFQFLCFQPGPRPGMARLFLIVRGRIEEMLGIISPPLIPAEVMSAALTRAGETAGDAVTADSAERIGIVSHHLFSPKASQGVFVRLAELDERGILKALRDLQKQKTPELEEGEGVVKELQAL